MPLKSEAEVLLEAHTMFPEIWKETYGAECPIRPALYAALACMANSPVDHAVLWKAWVLALRLGPAFSGMPFMLTDEAWMSALSELYVKRGGRKPPLSFFASRVGYVPKQDDIDFFGAMCTIGEETDPYSDSNKMVGVSEAEIFAFTGKSRRQVMCDISTGCFMAIWACVEAAYGLPPR